VFALWQSSCRDARQPSTRHAQSPPVGRPVRPETATRQWEQRAVVRLCRVGVLRRRHAVVALFAHPQPRGEAV